ncbi:MAG: hypothetical protein HY592_03615 [Candidatus Omnitrophica bacterium]|nr:hypothetical protein [Candidatus Omnitrophota bacterium]
MKRALWFLAIAIFLMSGFAGGEEVKPKTSEKDANNDGKPDSFKTFLKGRNLILREEDTNFDGKIDKRRLTQWDPDKKLQIFMNNRMQSTPNPGYVTLWREEDTDFDGKMDFRKERGKK